MWTYISRRLLIAIPTLLVITFINFALMRLAPGNPMVFMMTQLNQVGTSDQSRLLSGEFIKQRERELGLDQPVVVQYGVWLGQVLQGNLGTSMRNLKPIGPELLVRLRATLQLTVLALLVSVIIGVVFGAVAAFYQNTWLDQLISGFSFLVLSTPGFLIGLAAISVLALRLELFPTGRMFDSVAGDTLLGRIHHLILPVLVMGISGSAGLIRFTRTSVLEAKREPFVMYARAKGASERRVRLKHIFRNALIPVITIIGYELPGLFGGSALFETIFLWPGLGQWMAQAVASRDYSVMMVVISITALLIVLSNLFVDVAYTAVDPRVRFD